MVKMTQAAALALLSDRRHCLEIGEWLPNRQKPFALNCSSGVVDSEGVRSPLLVDLIFQRGPKTKMVWYKFSIFNRLVWGLERVYQMDVQQYEKPLKNAHDLPHEHMGDERKVGQTAWLTWSFEDVLRHFSERTRIDFKPPVMHPDAFELKG